MERNSLLLSKSLYLDKQIHEYRPMHKWRLTWKKESTSFQNKIYHTWEQHNFSILKPLLKWQKYLQYKICGSLYLCMKFVIAEVEGCVDWSERFKVDVDFLLFPFFCDDGATVYHKAIGWDCNNTNLMLYKLKNKLLKKEKNTVCLLINCWLLLHRAILCSQANNALLLHVILNEWPQPFFEASFYIHWSCVLTALVDCYMAGVMWNCCNLGTCFVYTIQPCTSSQCHFMQSHIRWVHGSLAVTCHLHLLCATSVTQGWNRYWNKSQHRKLTPKKKDFLLLQEPATIH